MPTRRRKDDENGNEMIIALGFESGCKIKCATTTTSTKSKQENKWVMTEKNRCGSDENALF